jgi:hypothetical protein
LVLGSLDVLWLSIPRLQARGLKGTGEGEGEGERSNSVDLVDFVEVDGRIFLGNSSTQEGNTRHGRWDRSGESLDSQSCNFFDIRFVLAVDTANSHGRLQQGTFKHDTTFLKLLVNGRDDTFLDLCGGVNVVVSINQDFGFDDRDKTGFLANTSITGKSMRGFVDGVVGRESLIDIDAKGSTPFRESGTLGVVKNALVIKSVQTRAPGLGVSTTAEGFETSIDLDTRDDSGLIQEVNKGLAFFGVLVEGFLEQNGSRNAVTDIGGGEKELAPLEKR